MSQVRYDYGSYLPRGMYRNRALLDLAHKMDQCQNCGVSTPEGCEPAHSNLSEHGKGKGLKAHDAFFAALCHQCHAWADNQGGHGKDPTGTYLNNPEAKREMFVRAMHKTWLHLFQRGWLKVVA